MTITRHRRHSRLIVALGVDGRGVARFDDLAESLTVDPTPALIAMTQTSDAIEHLLAQGRARMATTGSRIDSCPLWVAPSDRSLRVEGEMFVTGESLGNRSLEVTLWPLLRSVRDHYGSQVMVIRLEQLCPDDNPALDLLRRRGATIAPMAEWLDARTAHVPSAPPPSGSELTTIGSR